MNFSKNMQNVILNEMYQFGLHLLLTSTSPCKGIIHDDASRKKEFSEDDHIHGHLFEIPPLLAKVTHAEGHLFEGQ